ncbi:hypothetical protein [Paenarthrobacter sp. NPDC058040]
MEVILTVEDPAGATSHVTAEAATYEDAKAAAEAKIPEGSKAIVIRTA